MTPPPPANPPPHLPQNLKKVGFKWGGVGGSGPKTHRGMCLLDKMMILQGVKLTIQPLGVGHANRPKKAQNGGVCGVFPYIRQPGFDLTTSAILVILGLWEGPWHGLHRPSGHYVIPHGCSSTRIVTK